MHFISRRSNERIRIKALTNSYKTFLGCALCGYDNNAAALEFHHVDPKAKDFSVAQFSQIGQGFEGDGELITEMNKCMVLCANCHREVHQLVGQKCNR